MARTGCRRAPSLAGARWQRGRAHQGAAGLRGRSAGAKHADASRKARRHKRQLEALGYDVILTPREAA